MKVLDLFEFSRRVAKLADLDFCGLDIKPCHPLGRFLPNRLEELVEYCRANPQYHIVSYLGDFLYVNRYIDNAHFYFLAEGDDDRHLVGVNRPNPEAAFRYDV